MSSIWPQALARSAVPTASLAFSIAASIAGSLSWDQAWLLVGVMLVLSNVGARTVWGSAKSRTHPTFGQTLTSSFGVPQNFVYMIDWSTSLKFVLKPRFWSVWSTICASWSAGAPVDPTTTTGLLP